MPFRHLAAMSDAVAHYKEAFDHFLHERLEPAIEAYRRCVAADPSHARAWNGLAMSLGKLGQLDGAIEAGKRLAELEPDDPLSHTSLSIFYQQKGMIAEAEEEKAIAMRLQMAQQESG
ncbi:MAG: tetratricopeptide repeat protein [bacterium]|nr:tetratricopeptide repeat protein [bacterium]MCP5067214.1 tetratricopeptide repeat protein [bacterium]